MRVIIKQKHFQLALNAEVRITDATTQRSMVTGHLLIKMPKLNYREELKFAKDKNSKASTDLKKKKEKANETTDMGGSIKVAVDYRNIVYNIDESDIPPLV